MPEVLAHGNLTSKSNILKRVRVDASDLVVDRQQLAAIVDDLRCCGGLYTPAVNWLLVQPRRNAVDDGRPYLDEAFSDQAVSERMSTMEKMLAAWIGVQRKPAGTEVVARYAPYLTAHDPLGLWTANVAALNVRSTLLEADLGTILDLNVIYSNSTAPTDRPSVILEIGGGYGRLAEAALNVFGDAIKYVLVDSVPGSLLYARDYLRRACPSARIGFYYDGDPFDLSRFDCYIAPSWHFDEINKTDYDICLNIESFQEMAQEQVDRYLCWFESVARDGALIYISNSHDYLFKGEWNYPATWRRLLCARIPRSWTADHRTEVFIKSNGDWSAANAATVAAYQWNLTQTRQRRPILLTGLRALPTLFCRSPVANAQAMLRRVKNRAHD